MMINALNSSSRVFMADFGDSTTPTWDNLPDGELNLRATFNATPARIRAYHQPATLMRDLIDAPALDPFLTLPAYTILQQEHLTD